MIFKRLKDYYHDMSIRGRIHLYIMAFIMFLMAILWVIQVVFFNAIYKLVKRNEATEVAQLVAQVINGEKRVEMLVEDVAAKEVCIVVFNSKMQQVQSLDGPRECIIHKMSHQEKIDIVNGVKDTNNRFLEYTQEDVTYRLVTGAGSRDFRFFSNDEKVETFVYVNKIVANDGEEYSILVNAQAVPINSIIDTSRMVLAIVTMFTFVFAFMLLIFVARTISDPIELINKKAKILAKGQYDVEFDIKGYKEINELSETMDSTAKELSNLENLRREFIANVSHDLRTPLTMISGYAEVMRDIPGENNSENAQVIINETKRLNNMVGDILSLSKIQSGAIKPNIQSYNITEQIEQIVKNMSEMLKSDGFKFTFNKERYITIEADQIMINRSFYNLLANAVNYSEDKKDITITQTVTDKTVKIEVTDSGKGISEHMQPYIWERYYKGTSSSKKSIASSGLGLSIVKTFVEAHGGVCGVKSKEGTGSTFWFEIKR